MRANQLRLWFASMAYVLICALRRIGLAHTQFARASCGTIRLKLLKIGALVRTSVRRIKLAMPSAFPYQAEYRAAHCALAAALTRTGKRDRNSPVTHPEEHCPHEDSQKWKPVGSTHNRRWFRGLDRAGDRVRTRLEHRRGTTVTSERASALRGEI
jgi:hypothetical protein